MLKKKIIIALICLGISVAAGFGQHIYLSEKFAKETADLWAAKQAMEAAGKLQAENTWEHSLPPLKEGQVKVTIRVDLYSALAGKVLPGDRVSVGFVPPAAAGDGSRTSLSGTAAEGLLITDVTNDKGRDIRRDIGGNSGNAYAAEEAMLPAAVTLVCESHEQAIALKEYEKSGSLFLMMAGAGEVS